MSVFNCISIAPEPLLLELNGNQNPKLHRLELNGNQNLKLHLRKTKLRKIFLTHQPLFVVPQVMLKPTPIFVVPQVMLKPTPTLHFSLYVAFHSIIALLNCIPITMLLISESGVAQSTPK
ncbi:unnamed protein product [Vicia faba]|uniref:Uncharacterized protein n=1 Tax=Vicia faba TaxID=3906 RepID=A0AAV0Z7P8_VICFA|nr:unnamed protein product [Vicia faba]